MRKEDGNVRACGGRAVSVKILRNQALKEKHMRNKEERRKRK